MIQPTGIEMIAKYLIDNGFDGLQYENECGCFLDDLRPCGEDMSHCSAGYRHTNVETEYGRCDVIRPYK